MTDYLQCTGRRASNMRSHAERGNEGNKYARKNQSWTIIIRYFITTFSFLTENLNALYRPIIIICALQFNDSNFFIKKEKEKKMINVIKNEQSRTNKEYVQKHRLKNHPGNYK